MYEYIKEAFAHLRVPVYKSVTLQHVAILSVIALVQFVTCQGPAKDANAFL